MDEQYRPGLLSGALLCLLLTCGTVSYAQVATLADIDRAEQVGWSDPQAALQRLDKLQPQAQFLILHDRPVQIKEQCDILRQRVTARNETPRHCGRSVVRVGHEANTIEIAQIGEQ